MEICRLRYFERLGRRKSIMWNDAATRRHNVQERNCVLMIYGVPVLLSVISLCMEMLHVYRLVPWSLASYLSLFMWVNACLAGLVSASGEVFRQGTLARRVASGLLYGVVGIALYGVTLMSLMFAQHWIDGLIRRWFWNYVV